MIRRGFVYRAANVFRDPKASRLVLVMTSNARNEDPRSPTVVAVPLTTRLKGGIFRDRWAAAWTKGTLEAVIAAVVDVLRP